MTDPTMIAAEALAAALERAAQETAERGLLLKTEGERLLAMVDGLRAQASMFRGGLSMLSDATDALASSASLVAPAPAPAVVEPPAVEPPAPQAEPPATEPETQVTPGGLTIPVPEREQVIRDLDRATERVPRLADEARREGEFPPPPPVRVKPEPPAKTPPSPRVRTRSDSNRERIFERIQRAGTQGIGLSPLVADVGISQTVVSRYIRQLEHDGRILRKTGGHGARRGARYVAVAPVTTRRIDEDEAPAEPPPQRTPFTADLADLPEDLRRFPAASSGGPLAQRIETAQFQKRVYDVVQASESVVVGDVERALDDPTVHPKRVARNLADLTDAGLIRRTGDRRYARKGPFVGRESYEYAPLEAPVAEPEPAPEPEPEPAQVEPEPEPQAEPVAEPEPEPEPDAPEGEADVLRTVRDWVTKQEPQKPWSPKEAAEGVGLPLPVVLPCLEVLAERKTVVDVGFGDLRLFAYDKPREPGKAAQLDAARHKREARANGRTGGAPVPGTGRGLKVSDPDVRKLVDDILKVPGADVEMAPSGHYDVTYKGKRQPISGTPRSPRTVLNERAMLRRDLGLKL